MTQDSTSHPSIIDEDITVPLVFDIDGTLVKGDTTRTSFMKYCKKHLWCNKSKGGLSNVFAILKLIIISLFIVSLITLFICVALILTFFLDFIIKMFLGDVSKVYSTIELIKNYCIYVLSFVTIGIIGGLIFAGNQAKLFLYFCKDSTRAGGKEQIAQEITLTKSDWSFIPETLTFLKIEHLRGRPIILATGTYKKYAQMISMAVQEELNSEEAIVFYATENKINLVSSEKRKLLVEKFGEKGFIYVGNSRDDLDVWKHSLKPTIVIQNKWSSVAKDLLEQEKTISVISSNKQKRDFNKDIHEFTYKQYDSYKKLKATIKNYNYLWILYEQCKETAEEDNSTFQSSLWSIIKPKYYFQRTFERKFLCLIKDVFKTITLSTMFLGIYSFFSIGGKWPGFFEKYMKYLDTIETLGELQAVIYQKIGLVLKVYIFLFFMFLCSFYTYELIRFAAGIMNNKLSSRGHLTVTKENNSLGNIGYFFCFTPLLILYLWTPIFLFFSEPVYGTILFTSSAICIIATLLTLDNKHPTNFYVAFINTIFYGYIWIDKAILKLI